MMFQTLFAKECKQILHSLVFYIYLVIFILFMVSQLGENEVVTKPQQGEKFYGTMESTDPQKIMAGTLADLVVEIERNSFSTYPTGFYREVILTDIDLDSLKAIVEMCTGKDWKQIIEEQTAYYAKFDCTDPEDAYAADAAYTVSPKDEIGYHYFESEMEKVCQIVGSGSEYAKEKYEASVAVPMTYEDALGEYEAICENDGITDTFMRLFCDYAGILLGLLPIFLGVTRCVRDKRAKVEEVIYSKEASSGTIVFSRYLANVVMMFIPVLILAFVIQTSYIYQAGTLGVTPHYFAFLFYSVMWILPTILFVLAVSFFLTELLNGIIAIIIQVFWALASLMSVSELAGHFGLNLIPRWNMFGGTLEYLAQREELYQNRLVYTVLAFAIIAVSICIYNYKRRGGRCLNAKKH